MPTKKARPPATPKDDSPRSALGIRPTKHQELIPGHGGRLTFVEDGVILFIPKSFFEDWPAIAVEVGEKNERISLERHEEPPK